MEDTTNRGRIILNISVVLGLLALTAHGLNLGDTGQLVGQGMGSDAGELMQAELEQELTDGDLGVTLGIDAEAIAEQLAQAERAAEFRVRLEEAGLGLAEMANVVESTKDETLRAVASDMLRAQIAAVDNDEDRAFYEAEYSILHWR